MRSERGGLAAHDGGAAQLGRRERNKLEKRTRIVAAARRLFAERGYKQTTTQQIAEAADVGTGTLFLYASSKEELLVMVFGEDTIDAVESAFLSVDPEESLLEQLMQAFTHLMEHHAADPALTRVLLGEVLFAARRDPDPALVSLMSLFMGRITELLRRAPCAHPMRGERERRTLAEALLASYLLDLLEWLRGGLGRGSFEVRLRAHIATRLGEPSNRFNIDDHQF